MKILLADDHMMFRQGLSHLLAETLPDTVIGEAATADETLARIKDESWDVLVLDLNLAGHSGLDVLKTVHRTHPGLAVLVLSGHSEDEYAARAIRAGAAGYLTKDKGTYEVFQAVQKICAGGKYITPSVADILATTLAGGADQSGHAALSDREFLVLEMIVAGKTMTQIANELSLSIKTVSTYRKRVADKIGLKTDAELTRYALEKKLVR